MSTPCKCYSPSACCPPLLFLGFLRATWISHASNNHSNECVSVEGKNRSGSLCAREIKKYFNFYPKMHIFLTSKHKLKLEANRVEVFFCCKEKISHVAHTHTQHLCVCLKTEVENRFSVLHRHKELPRRSHPFASFTYAAAFPPPMYNTEQTRDF